MRKTPRLAGPLLRQVSLCIGQMRNKDIRNNWCSHEKLAACRLLHGVEMVL